MKRTIALLIPVLLLSACAATAPVKDDQVPTVNVPVKPDFTQAVQAVQPMDDNCADLAKRAKGIAFARDAGISQDEVQFIVTSTSDYPLGPMVREVYNRRDISPTVGATNSYAVCIKVTYEVMAANLRKAEAAFEIAEQERLRQELAAKKKPVKKPAAAQPKK